MTISSRLKRAVASWCLSQINPDTGRLLHYAPTVETGLRALQRRWPAVKSRSEDEPIFILSAGWRSGSTLLQRLVMSSNRVLIWGEPFGHAGQIHSLSGPLRCFTDAWPEDEWIVSEDERPVAREASWVANLYPPIQDYLDAHVSFLTETFAVPARRLGKEQWGLKEVRLTIDHALYLKWVFPRGKFLFLYRNPYAAYRSYRRWGNWFTLWPAAQVTTPRQFGQTWRSLLEGYISGYKKVDGILVQYEALDRSKVQEIADYLGTPLDDSVLQKNLDGAEGREFTKLPFFERRSLRRAVEPLAPELGYYQP